MSFFWTVITTIVEPVCIVIVIVVLRKTRLDKKRKQVFEQAAKEAAEKAGQRKIGFQQAYEADAKERPMKLPKWPDYFRKIRRLFPPRKMFQVFRAESFHCCYFYDYCPETDTRGLRDDRNRDMILSFKDGQNEVAIHLVTEFIFRYIVQKDIENWVFCVIPASTLEKTGEIDCSVNGFPRLQVLETGSKKLSSYMTDRTQDSRRRMTPFGIFSLDPV